MSTLASRQCIADTARDRGGYFTAMQAKECGYSYQSQHYHTVSGDWIRVANGIYRLRDFPSQPWEELIILTLRSRNRAGQPQAIISHETALAIHEISDANPAKIYLTVPPGFRKVMPPSVILHQGVLAANDWEEHSGYRVTTPLKTLVDIAASSESWPFLDGAVRDALRGGLVRKKQLLAVEGPDEVRVRLRSALDAVERLETRMQG